MTKRSFSDMIFMEAILPSLFEKFGPGIVISMILNSVLSEKERSFTVEFSQGITVADIRSIYDTEKVYRIYIPSSPESMMTLSYGTLTRGTNCNSVVSVLNEFTGKATLQNLVKILEEVIFRLNQPKE